MLKLSIGLMSGTSMDGIDAALICTDGHHHIEELGHISISYNPAFRILLKATEYTIKKMAEKCLAENMHSKEAILNLTATDFTHHLSAFLQEKLKLSEPDITRKMSELSQYLYGTEAKNNLNLVKPLAFEDIIEHSTRLHAEAAHKLLEATGYCANQITVVGCHGQAFFHRPSAGLSIILCNGPQLANHLNITVVTDFRSRDIAFGGQGAPFAPLYHHALAYRDNKIPCVVVNCGGIANITLIYNDNIEDLIGFDTGPGNGLLDNLVRQQTKGREQMDVNGHYGAAGKVDKTVLAALYDKAIIKDGCNYFSSQPPKSLDINDLYLVPELDNLTFEDACRTLAVFTADSIVQSLRLNSVSRPIPLRWILAGGGWNNPIILLELTERLKQELGHTITVETADQAGWSSQALEAQIFAYLAVRSLLKLPLSMPNTTRVSKPLSGGCAFYPMLRTATCEV
ncbi:MAG: anhydro-N-acetylmuramic acid kinase [Legionellales bacterium]|nr:anhydro-N-acetylmuramic acid kinase [Legionellales bacterium]